MQNHQPVSPLCPPTPPELRTGTPTTADGPGGLRWFRAIGLALLADITLALAPVNWARLPLRLEASGSVSSGAVRRMEAGPPAEDVDAVDALQKLASEAVRTDPVNLGRVRITIKSGPPRILYDPARTPLARVLREGDPLALPLEALIRADALERDLRAAVPKESFWVEPLREARQLVVDAIPKVQGAASGEAQQRELSELKTALQAQFKRLDDAIVSYAHRQNLQLERSREPAAPFTVQIKIGPPKAQLRMMPFLAYLKSRRFHSPLDDQWNVMLEGKRYLIGRYRYRVEWPASAGGPDEGNITVDHDTTLPFVPKGK